MPNKYTTKHLLHQPEKIKSSSANELEKTCETTISHLPQINRNQNHIGNLVKHRSIKFVVHKPHQSSPRSSTQEGNAGNLSESDNTKLNTATFTINTNNIAKQIGSVKTKCMNYFNQKTS